MTAEEVTRSVAGYHWPWHRNVIVPRVQYLGCYGGADLLVLKSSGYMYEVETHVLRAQ